MTYCSLLHHGNCGEDLRIRCLQYEIHANFVLQATNVQGLGTRLTFVSVIS